MAKSFGQRRGKERPGLGGALVAQMSLVDVEQPSAAEQADLPVGQQEVEIRSDHPDPAEFFLHPLHNLDHCVAEALSTVGPKGARGSVGFGFPVDQLEEVQIPDTTKDGDRGHEDLVS